VTVTVTAKSALGAGVVLVGAGFDGDDDLGELLETAGRAEEGDGDAEGDAEGDEGDGDEEEEEGTEDNEVAAETDGKLGGSTTVG
jgi:hypothetical protein